jgi:hypothetical protein
LVAGVDVFCGDFGILATDAANDIYIIYNTTLHRAEGNSKEGEQEGEGLEVIS